MKSLTKAERESLELSRGLSQKLGIDPVKIEAQHKLIEAETVNDEENNADSSAEEIS